MTMFRALTQLWHDGSIMRDVVQYLVQMVSDSDHILRSAWAVCRGEASADEMVEDVCNRDKAINRGERTVRRLLTQHLTINPGDDVSGCLAVMIMAKDIERMGDDARAILTIAKKIGKVSDFKYFARLDSIAQRISAMLPDLGMAVDKSTEELAHRVMDSYQDIKKDTKSLQNELLSADMPAPEAVATTLINRHLLRVNAHAGNAASAVIFPIENIDFVSRGLREAEAGRNRLRVDD